MAITAYDICKEVYGLSGFGIPSTFFGGNDPDDNLIFYLLRRVGRDIAKYRWNELLRTARINITGGNNSYNLPNDFREFVPNSMRVEGDLRPIDFPAPIETWAHIDAQIGATGILHRMRLQGGKLVTHPLDTDDFVVRFEYLSNFPVIDQDGVTGKKLFEQDNDTWTLDEDLIIKGLKVKWSVEKGLDTLQADSGDYTQYLNELKGTDSSARRIQMGNPPIYYPNAPYTNTWK